MSAPPGWHPQPDGRERWWDGQQWTDDFREQPAGGRPADHTQALDVDRTQAIPATPPAGGEGAPTYPSQQDYGYPSGGGGLPPGYAAPGTPYGAPGGQYPPPSQGMSSTAKGCLVAGAVGVVLIIIVAVLGVFLFSRVANQVVDDVASGIATAFPTEVPTDVPSDLPTELPSIGGDAVEVAVGDGFDLPRASIAPGWSVQAGDFGSEVVGMTASFTEGGAFPLVFSMSFQGAGGSTDTVCSSVVDQNDATTAQVNCLPLLGDVSDADRVTVTPTF